jgi:glycine cleavage system aminomethyltransferase T
MKRSALYPIHRRAGATFADYFGWELPAFYVSSEQEARQIREGVGLADISYMSKFDGTKEPEGPSWRLGANHYFNFTIPSANSGATGIDVTSVYAALHLVGPRAREVLGKLTSLNLSDAALPDKRCAQASLAHVPAIFLREDIGPLPAFYLLITRDYAESGWEAILHAGHEFNLCPSGLESLRALQR